MKTIKLGKSDIHLPMIGSGCLQLSFPKEVDQDKANEIITNAN